MTDAATAPPAPAEGRHVLQTGLLGSLSLPDGLGDAGDLEALSRRAALYATRARGDGGVTCRFIQNRTASMEAFSRISSAHCPRIAAVSTVSPISGASSGQLAGFSTV